MKTIRRTRAGSVMKRRTKQTIFYWSILALPLLQFGIFYVGVNFNSLLLAFRQFDVMTNESSFVGFSNFAQVFRDIGQLEYFSQFFAAVCREPCVRNGVCAAVFLLYL